MTTLERLKNHIVENEQGCWVWSGYVRKDGYANFRIGSRFWKAHRASFYLHKGQIPDGLDLDHLCRNRACVNPKHLDPVTRSVNCKRGNTGKHLIGAHNTHALKDHPKQEYFDEKGRSRCRECRRQQAIKYNAKRIN